MLDLLAIGRIDQLGKIDALNFDFAGLDVRYASITGHVIVLLYKRLTILLPPAVVYGEPRWFDMQIFLI